MTLDSKIWLIMSIVFSLGFYALFRAGPTPEIFAYYPDGNHVTLGWASVGLLAICVFHSWRKRELLQFPGPLLYWRGAHILAGFALFTIWIFHANASFGFTWLQWLITAILFALVVTGAWGIYRHGTIPKVMNETLIDPVYKDELKDIVGETLHEIHKLTENRSERFGAIYQRHLLRYISTKRPTDKMQKSMTQRLFGPADINPNAAVHDLSDLTEEEKALFYEVAEKVLELVEIRRSVSYQRQMNRWLTWHIGLTSALIILLFFHIFSSFYH